MTDEKTDTKPERVTRPKAGKGDLQRRGGRPNYEKGHDRIFGSKTTKTKGVKNE